MNKYENTPVASRSTSKNIRLYTDTDSSPAGRSNHKYYKDEFINRSQNNKHSHSQLEQVPYKYYRDTREKKSGKKKIRPMTSQYKTSKVIVPNHNSTEVMSQNVKMHRPHEFNQPTKPKQRKVDRGRRNKNMQQAGVHTSEVTDGNSSFGLEYIPNSILESTYKKKTKKRIIVMKKKTTPKNYNMEDPLLSQSSDQNMEYNKQEYQYSEKSSSLKGLYQSNPELQEQYSKQHSGSEESL